MKYTLLSILIIMALGCQSQKKKIAPKLEPDGHDSTYFWAETDTVYGYLQYRGVNGEERVVPGMKVHSQVFQMHKWIPTHPKPIDTTSGGGVITDMAWGDSDPHNASDYYFITVGGHTGQIPSEQVIVFLKSKKNQEKWNP